MSKRCMGCMEVYKDEFEVCPYCGYIEGTDAAEALFMQPNTILHDRYIVGKALGFGGFGVTYIGWDGKLEQKVAIKEYLPSEFSTRMPGQSRVTVFNGDKSEQFHAGLDKFTEEAKHLAKFQNEIGIVKVFDSFIENETAYIIMEFLDGETLTSRLKQVQTFSEDEAIEMLLPVMNSLKNVHAEGILHRDIAPDNIFLNSDGTVKLIDFGASRYATTSHSRSLTVIIKPGYSPEEQYRSRGDQGTHTDVYALAATMYKMVTGVTPPDAMERRAKYENNNKDILVEPHKINKDISVNVETAILNGMNVRIEDRTPDIETFIAELTSTTTVKRRYGKIKKIDVFAWPLWLKILVPSLLAVCLTFGILLATDVIKFDSLFSDEIVIPEGVVEVPDVELMDKDEAISLIEEKNLLASAAGGNVESEYVDAGIILLQTPTGGSFANVNSEVILTVSSGGGVIEAVNGISTVPYVVWATEQDAIARLKEAGLAKPKITKASDDNVPAGNVISQSVEDGEKVDEGTQITIVISTGPAAFDMPNVIGEDASDAKATLEGKGLSVSLTYEKNDDVPEGNVIIQSIKSGAKVKKGDSLVLTVSSGKNVINVANVVGMTKESAVAELEGQKLKVNNILENYSSDVEKGKVISQNPTAGTGLLKGDSVTLYVSKGKQPVTVTFNANGGSVGTGSATVYYTAKYGDLPTPTRTGYKFIGWYTSTEGGTKISKDTKVSNTTEHILYAQWSANSYIVTLDANGGSVSANNKNVTYDSAYGLLPTPTRTGYTFEGWYTASNDKVTDKTTVSTASDHKLVAKWKAKTYTITFNANGGSVSTSSKNISYGSAYGTLPTPTRDYYTFNGWYTSASGGNKVTTSTVMGDSNITLYAHWTQKEVSGWVLASEVPSSAQIVNTKWTYTKTETTESTSSSLSGWTQTGNYWKQTGSGSTNYATFPSGFNTSHWIYTSFAKSAYSGYENTTNKRVVSNTWAGYVYWHWMYDVSYANTTNRTISHRQGYWNPSGGQTGSNAYNYKYFSAFTSTVNCPYLSNNYCCSQNLPSYNCNGIIPDTSAAGVGTPRYFRFEYYTSKYTDYQKMYQYKKVTSGLESSTEVTASGNISNVQKYVKYRPK